jgi:cytochrome c oxidase assembly protein Cox11
MKRLQSDDWRSFCRWHAKENEKLDGAIDQAELDAIVVQFCASSLQKLPFRFRPSSAMPKLKVRRNRSFDAAYAP